MSSLSTLPKGDSAWLLRKSIQRVMQQVSVLETNIGSSTTGNSANTQIIFNDAGTLRGDAQFTWNKTLNRLTVDGDETITGDLTINNNATITGDLTARNWFVTGGSLPGVGNGNPFAYRIGGGGLGIGAATETGTTAPIVFYCGAGGVEQFRIAPLGVFTWSDGAGGTRMTLNSTGLGVGVASPAYKLDVAGTVSISGGTSNARRLQFNASGAYANWIEADGVAGANYLRFATGNAEVMRIDSSGNVGVGVTPSAWNAAFKGIDISTGGAIAGSSDSVRLFSNSAFNTAGNNVYKNAATAGRYDIQGNVHTWSISTNAPSAGGTITFSPAMTLDASGNLLVGATSGSFGSRLIISTDSGTTKWATGPLPAGPLNYYITANNSQGVFLNGTSATAWTAISDERFKDIIEPITNAVSKVGSLRSVIGKFKTDAEGTRRSFLIAQDVIAAFPEAAVATDPDKLGVTYTEVIPLLVAAIKELTARVQTLEAK